MHNQPSINYRSPHWGRRSWLTLAVAFFAVLMLLQGQPALAADPATVAVGDGAALGQVLVGPDGMTLYMFDKDEPGKSNCYGDCAVKWPPLLVKDGETPVAGEGVTAKLGVVKRDDGTMIVTANGWPLYYWYKDTKVGDTAGQAVGDVWWVMAPDGTINRAAPAAAAAPAAPAAPATVSVGEAGDLGQILVGADGMSLYMFDKDEPGKTNCYGDCAVKWPPLLVKEGETPVAGEGVTAKLGVVKRDDGTMMMTANDWPLYYWFKDTKAGDATGQAVGDVWWVMAADGTINRTAPAAAAAPAAAPAAPAPEPQQMPVTGGDPGVLSLAVTGLTLLVGSAWVALRRPKK